MSASKYLCVWLLTALVVAVSAASTQAAFTSFVIRNGAGGPPTIQPNNFYVPGATEFIVSEGGQKAGWGSSDIDGGTIGQIADLTITRHDDTGRFTAGSGPAVAPYFNIWVTDGLGNFAALANEPSNPDFQPLFVDNGDGSKTYSLSYSDLASKPVQVYETPNGGYGATNTWVHNLVGINGPLTFGDVANLTIAAPSPAYITTPANAVGSGAPRTLGTNVAYGVNWIFGDTISNYVSGMEGYVVSAPGVTAVPEPTSIAMFGLAAIFGSFVVRRRRRG